jgi:hypothetical protein
MGIFRKFHTSAREQLFAMLVRIVSMLATCSLSFAASETNFDAKTFPPAIAVNLAVTSGALTNAVAMLSTAVTSFTNSQVYLSNTTATLISVANILTNSVTTLANTANGFTNAIIAITSQRPQPPAPSWKLETWKILLDKGLLTLVFVVFGAWASRNLEIFKSEQAFSTELNKLRVEKVAQVWKALYDYENGVLKAVKIWNRRETTHLPKHTEQLIDAIKDVKEVRESTQQIIQENKFWLGKDLSRNVNVFLKPIEEVIQAFSKSQTPPVDFKIKMDACRQTIENIHEQLLRGQVNRQPRKHWWLFWRRLIRRKSNESKESPLHET